MDAERDGRDTRWEAHRAARRALILDAAIEMLEESHGGEMNVRDVAVRAGLGRAVVYRHFDDRAAIERALRGRVYERLIDELAPAVEAGGSIHEIIRGIVRTYVDWAVRHPVLHRLVSESGRSVGEEPPEETAVRVSEVFTDLVHSVLDRLEVVLAPEDERVIQPLVLGMVGHALAVVRSWLGREGERPTAEELVEHLARGFWYQFEGHARDRGYSIDPDAPLGPG